MTSLTFAHLRRVNVARCIEGWQHPLEAWSLDDWLTAVGGEVGEGLNVVKKLYRVRDGIVGNAKGADALVADLADELADAVIYLDLLAARFGAEIYDTDFETFRMATHDHYTMGGSPIPLPRLCTLTMMRLGRLAGFVADIADGVKRRDAPALVLGHVVRALDGIAWAIGIDLGDAVVRKFNATSEKHGMPHRLEVA